MNFTPNLKSRDQINAELPRFESVSNYMVPLKSLITFRPEQNIHEIIEVMTQRGISGGPVLDENHELVGIISEKDCLRIMVDQAYYNTPYESPKVSDYMTKKVITISHDSDVLSAAREFINSPIRRLPIVQDGKLVGQVSRRDILRAAKNVNPGRWP
jgi:CBS domain-containing protein